MYVCAQKKKVTPLYTARTRHAVRVHALHVAHEVQTARHTRAPVHVTHTVLCSTPSAPCRPTSVVQRFWRFVGVYPPSWCVCCGRSVSQVVWLFRCHWQVLRSSRSVPLGRLLFGRCSFECRSPGFFTWRRCPRCHQSSDWMVHCRSRVKLVEQDINFQRSEIARLGRHPCQTAGADNGHQVRLQATSCAW